MKTTVLLLVSFFLGQTTFAHEAPFSFQELIDDHIELSGSRNAFDALACRQASSREIASVDEGNQKKDLFLSRCAAATSGSTWCLQLIRPNPNSISSFRCTYGADQVHQLIHPDEQTWDWAFQAVRLVEELERNQVRVCEIYNWWRPEPYNKNVGGAAGRHPFGTSVDVRFCAKTDQEKAHRILCSWRKKGALRALGYYSSTALHLGVGDSNPNTWGKSCP